MKVYTYKNCGTCKKATKWLEAQGIEFDEIPIRDKPPSQKALKEMLKHYDGELKRLFNTAGGDYREMNLKEKLPDMTQAEAIKLLASNGNLVKRPFLRADDFGFVGFKEPEWSEKLG